MKKEWVAMVLAGGSGSRLKPLTRKLPKPALLFGGRYRIVDYTLSNCIHSGLDRVGVLVQYEPFPLSLHINTCSHWSSEIMRGNMSILPPHLHEDGGGWYSGTANAVLQNLEFIEKYEPEHVLIVSADHVYRMDYRRMLDFHKANRADVTVAVTKVSMQDATRFGIMKLDGGYRITEFEEKPRIPKSNQASMGIYIFRWNTLRRALLEDECKPESSHDFGKNIIPDLLGQGACMMAYSFNDYWMDIGTLQSLWQANMDLLEEDTYNRLHVPEWTIYSESRVHPPLYINHTAQVKNSILGEGCHIRGCVRHSVLFPEVTIGKGAKIINSVIMSNSCIEEYAIIENSIVDSETVVKARSCITGMLIGSESISMA